MSSAHSKSKRGLDILELEVLCAASLTPSHDSRCMFKNRKYMKNCGLVLNMTKRCFCFGVFLHFWFVMVGGVVFVFFGGFNGFVVGFCVFGKVANVLNMLFFLAMPKATT